jgi:t-SNARE complex subunit (syntaxin)
MFLYLSALVDEQGEQLDTIEKAVDATRDYTGEAVIQLTEAKKSKESADKKKFWCWAIVIVAAIFGLLILLWQCGCFRR